MHTEAVAAILEHAKMWAYEMVDRIFLSKEHPGCTPPLALVMYWLSDFHECGDQSFRALIEKGIYAPLNQMGAGTALPLH